MQGTGVAGIQHYIFCCCTSCTFRERDLYNNYYYLLFNGSIIVVVVVIVVLVQSKMIKNVDRAEGPGEELEWRAKLSLLFLLCPVSWTQ